MRNVLIVGCLFAVLGTAGFAQDAMQSGSNQQNLASAKAQDATASLSGTVSDATGALIAGATVVVRDSSGRTVTVTSDAAGRYIATGLAPGSADITISAPGFADSVTNMQLTASEKSTFDSPMQPAVSSTSVEVTAMRTTQVENENAELSGTITQKQLVGIGLNGRNFLSLITLTPGVSNQTGQDEAKVGVVGSAKFSINGGRTEYNTFDVDGNDVLNTDIAASHGHSTLLVYPSLDAIQEMKVLTSNYGAQYGRSASGTVEVSIKSGAEQFHGNAYEFIRNEAFNSRNYFDAPGKAPLYRRQDFGFTFGGPFSIPHVYAPKAPRTNFFLSEEWRKEKTPIEFNQGVPSDAERGYNVASQSYTGIADFSDVCPDPHGTILDCPGDGHTGNYFPFQNNQFPIDPNATAILKTGLIPRANATTGCVHTPGIDNCYVYADSPPTDYREDLLRIDHTVNDKWKIYATGVHDHWKTITAIPQWPNHANSFPTVKNDFQGPGISGTVHVTTVVTPSLLNDFSVGATRQKIVLGDIAGDGVSSLSPSGLENVTADPIGSIFQNCYGGEHGPNNSCIGGKLPGLVFAGSNKEYGGTGFNADTSYMPWYHTRIVGTLTDNVSKYFTRHTLLFGAQLVLAGRHEFGGVNGANSGNQQGLLTFTNTSTPNTTRNAFADFEYYSPTVKSGGNIYSYQQDNTQTTYKVSYWTLEPYLQDNYKVNSRLTINVGLRVSLFQNWKPDGNALYNWDPAAFNPSLMSASGISLKQEQGYFLNGNNANGIPIAFDGSTLNPVQTNGLVRCGANGVPQSCQTSHLFNAAPRVGFAWDPTGTGKTSIRAGYGIFYEHGTGSEANVGSLMGNPPQVISMTQYNPDSYSKIGLAGSGSAYYSNTRIETPLNMISIPDKTIWPYVQQWSFGVQREINKDTQVSMAYVGSKGTHLAVTSQLNHLPAVPKGQNPFAVHQPITSQTCVNEVHDLGDLQGNNNQFYNPDGSIFVSYLDKPATPPTTGNPGGTPAVTGNPAAYKALLAACDGSQPFSGLPGIYIAENALRPYQGVGNVEGIRNVANSSYHSLQVTVHHFDKPIDVAATLTYSHSIDTASDRFSSNFIDLQNLAENKASSDFDQRILMNINYTYQLPLLRLVRSIRDGILTPVTKPSDDHSEITDEKQDFGELSHLTQRIFSNWSLSGLTLYQTGTPFSVINSASSSGSDPACNGSSPACNGVSMPDNAGYALDVGPNSYPDVTATPGGFCARWTDTGTVGPILGNSCRFVAPRGLTRGNAGRNFMRNPTRTNFDMSLLKDMTVWHGGALQFRAEVFNVFNHTQFVLYDPIKGNTASNTISCYGDSTTGYSAGASSCTVGNGFLHPIEAHRPRTVQFGLKLQY